MFKISFKNITYSFSDLKDLLAKASPLRSADILANIAAKTEVERALACQILADVPLKRFLQEALIPYESDEITRLIIDSHDKKNFQTIESFTVGEFRDWLLSPKTTCENLSQIKFSLTPEMVAAVSKLMRIQDLILVSKKCSVVTKFRSTVGLPQRISTRLQPNHPTDDLKGIFLSIIDGLLLGSGDAMIGINPATDSLSKTTELLDLVSDLIQTYAIPTQSCVLTHITTILQALNRGYQSVDLIFQSIGGTQKTNESFGISLSLLHEAKCAGESLNRGTIGKQIMYFETGQGSALSANAHFDVDAQTVEARAYAVARAFDPFLVNSVVGFIGPEYLYNGKQIIRAGLEDHFCAKLLGVPMGCDICHTNHSDADHDDLDTLLTLLGTAGCNFIMGIPGSDDIMLNYQSTSFHDALYVRKLLNLKPAPEFEKWLFQMNITNESNEIIADRQQHPTQISNGCNSSTHWSIQNRLQS